MVSSGYALCLLWFSLLNKSAVAGVGYAPETGLTSTDFIGVPAFAWKLYS